MKTTAQLLLGPLLATLVVIAACTGEDLITPPVAEQEMQTLGGTADVPALWFTGRDSFGVALKGQVSGTFAVDESGRCPFETVVLSGAGTATHMGKMTLEQSHCVDPSSPDAVRDGEFSMVSVSGAHISGTYSGSLSTVDRAITGRDSLFAIFSVLDGEVPFADLSADRDLNRKGWATVEGLMQSDGTFSYGFDGWLFHHERGDPPARGRER